MTLGTALSIGHPHWRRLRASCSNHQGEETLRKVSIIRRYLLVRSGANVERVARKGKKLRAAAVRRLQARRRFGISVA
jgi:hypothetical protein